jgi:glycosyltransferase involved in cell wall biosynthesis
MSSTPRLSLIVSVYNQRELAPTVWASVFAQRVDVPFEVLVCDDGSPDDHLDVIRRLIASSPVDLRYIWQPDVGFRLSRSRNNAIRCARGDILVFADGDMWLAPTFLRDHAIAHEGPPGLVCGLRWTCTLPRDAPVPLVDESLLRTMRTSPHREHVQQEYWLRSTRPWLACLGGNFSVRNGPEVWFDEEFEGWGSEDRDLAYRLFRAGLPPRLLAEPNAVHLRHEGDAWTDMGHDQIVAFLRNKVRLRMKYPGGEMRPSLLMVTRCRFEPDTERWSIGLPRSDATADQILDQFHAWDRLRAEHKEAGCATVGPLE